MATITIPKRITGKDDLVVIRKTELDELRARAGDAVSERDVLTAGALFSTNATTSSFALTNLSSSLLKVNGDGSVIPAILGTDYQNFGYLFPSNSTSTNLTFSNGLTVSGGSISAKSHILD